MALQKIQLRPGIFREGTRYSNQGGWYDCDKIRFRSGLPEKMKGWVLNNNDTFLGTCRSLIQWSSLTAQNYIGLGTEKKYYVLYNGSYIDITPVVRTVTLAANQMSATNGSKRIYIRDVDNEAVVGDYVTISGATGSPDFAGIPVSEINKEHVLVDVTNLTKTIGATDMSATNGSQNLVITWANNNLSVGHYVTITGATGFAGIPSGDINTTHVITAARNKSITLTEDSMSATNGSQNLVITWASNGLAVGDFVTIANATTFAGIPAIDINTRHVITAVATNTITVVVATPATSTATGGGAASLTVNDIVVSVATPATSTATGGAAATLTVNDVAIDVVTTATSTAVGGGTPTLAYQLSVGLDTVVDGPGWGAGPWGGPVTDAYPSGVGWGESYGNITITQQLRLWTNDNYGQDLIINPRGGGIYYETQSDIEAGNRAVNITTFETPSYAPTLSQAVAVFGPTRNVIAFGCNPYDDNVQDPMLIRWSASENVGDWQPRADNDAGDFRLAAGSQFITHQETKQEIVIWTDIAVFSMRYVGPPFTFGLEQLGYGTSIIGPNAKVAVDDRVYWMGATAFFGYAGRIEQIPCAVKQYVFSDLNYNQAAKITCGTNVALGEVIWFYPSADAEEVDRYVTYNYLENVWYYGSLARTAWLDFADQGLPIATGTDNKLYDHEVGYDDGSTNPVTPISAYIQSSPFEIGDGDSMMFVRQIYPDVTFVESTVSQPSATFTLLAQNYPGAPEGEQIDSATAQAVATELNEFTQQVSLRLRGRAAAMRVESTGEGVAWRLGVPRFEMRTDGRR
jgi:hypothetical protein